MRQIDDTRLQTFIEKMLADLGGAYSIPTVRIGFRLGLFDVLRSGGPMSSDELAQRAGGLAPRYVREWALAQAAGGYVDYDPDAERFSLSPEQAMVFAEKDSPFYLAGAFELAAAMIEGEPKVENSIRTGGGVRWGDTAGCLFCATGAFFRPGIAYHGYPGTGLLRRPVDGKGDSDAEVSAALANRPRVVPADVPNEVRRRAAFHEAGHAIVGLHLDAAELVSVSVAATIRPDVAELQIGGGVTFKATAAVRERTRAQLLDWIAVKLGGSAAEEVMLGDRSAGAGGASGSDLHNATLLALAFEASYGLGDGLAYIASEDEAELFSAMRLDCHLRARVDKVLAEQFARVKRIMEHNRREIEWIAAAVLSKGTLSADEVRELISQQARFNLVDRFGNRTA